MQADRHRSQFYAGEHAETEANPKPKVLPWQPEIERSQKQEQYQPTRVPSAMSSIVVG